MLKRTLLAASLMMVAGASNAELVHADFQDGDRMVTVDTETGLAWMKFDVTRYHSLVSAENATVAGGAFEGWKLASADQVYSLWDSFFDVGTYNKHQSYVQFINPESSHGIEMAEYNAFKEYMGGGAWGSSGYHYGFGQFWQDKDSSTMGQAGFIGTASGYGHYFSPEQDLAYSSSNYSGVYMVMDASTITIDGDLAFQVPVGGAVIASLGLLGMAGLRRRKSK